jgi:hypothetical protein
LLAQVKRRPGAGDNGLRVALLHAQFGERDSALVWLGYTQWTISELAMLRGDPVLDSLRSDPRYGELLVKIGLKSAPAGSTLSAR